MSSDFFIQATNLLAQQLANIKGEEIYAETACMAPEYREVIAALRAIQAINPKTEKSINKLMPFLVNLGKASWVRSELTDLGLRVGSRNFDETSTDEVDNANIPADSE